MAPSLLLDLPPELRERILVALLERNDPIRLQHGFQEPAISKANHQLKIESLAIYYSVNTFSIDNSGYVSPGSDDTKRRIRHRSAKGGEKGRAHDGYRDASLEQLRKALNRIHPAHIARIRYIRLEWNAHCKANAANCFDDRPDYAMQRCDDTLPGNGWRAPVFMEACNISLIPRKPWATLSISYYENDMCRQAAPPLYEKVKAMVLRSLSRPLPTLQRRQQLSAEYIIKLAEKWMMMTRGVTGLVDLVI